MNIKSRFCYILLILFTISCLSTPKKESYRYQEGTPAHKWPSMKGAAFFVVDPWVPYDILSEPIREYGSLSGPYWIKVRQKGMIGFIRIDYYPR